MDDEAKDEDSKKYDTEYDHEAKLSGDELDDLKGTFTIVLIVELIRTER